MRQSAARALNICPAFWLLDSPTRMFVLYHEASHLVGSKDFIDPTPDYVESAIIYAYTDPDRAYRNANTYALYIENRWSVW